MKKLICAVAVLLVATVFWVPSVSAQNRVRFGGQFSAIDYAYGVVPNIQPLVIDGNSVAAGTNTLTVRYGSVTLGDGTILAPLATNAPIVVGGPSNTETVTPSAVSCSTPQLLDTCTFTATFSNAHGGGESITSASYGLQEAINAANAAGGGAVIVAAPWAKIGGSNSTITSAAPYSNVTLLDTRMGSSYWSMQPSTLTSLNVPTTLTSSTVFSASSGTGTWTASTVHACITLVDALGGEGPCSADYSFTATASVPVTFAAPLGTLTGAVGWRAYAGATYNGAYLLPVTSSACTLTTLETVVPACALTSTATFTAIYVNTTTLRPNAQTSPTVNLNLPYAQGHTTFAYSPSGSVPVQFQSNYGPFTAFGSTTSAQVDVIGSVNLPAGYLNTIGRVVRVSGKIAATVNTAAIPTVTVSLGWVGGTTAGAPVAVCTNTGAAYGSSAAFNLTFECTMTTNALGSSAATIMTKGIMDYNAAAGGAAGVTTIDTGVAAIGSLGLSQQNTVFVSYTSGTNTTSAVQLLDLHVETLQ